MKRIVIRFLSITFALVLINQLETEAQTMKNRLTEFEKHIIIDKGTERPFTGKYYKSTDEGTYHCKQCGAALYRSSDKFDSGCGWPSFDDEIPGAVKRVPDRDGLRTEITCTACGGHLGHVFLGEEFTAKNTRHCVNSASLDFVAKDDKTTDKDKTMIKKSSEIAIFAGGCFWGVEHLMMKTAGVISTQVGYIGGSLANPTYEDVCSGRTGHAEAIKIVYDPSFVSYETLAQLFFEIHDPTQVDRQGPDIGEQYRSAIFYTKDEHKQTAEKLIKTLQSRGYNVVTDVEPASTFYPAEDYHQKYYEHKGTKPYCHKYTKRF